MRCKFSVNRAKYQINLDISEAGWDFVLGRTWQNGCEWILCSFVDTFLGRIAEIYAILFSQLKIIVFLCILLVRVNVK